MKPLILATLLLSACATQPTQPKPVLSQEVIQQEQKVALAIISEISEIENKPAGELTIADKSRRKALYGELSDMRTDHILSGRDDDHLSWESLSKLQ